MYKAKERKNLEIKNVNFNNNKNGITLIALIITIIVLLILAGVSISMVVGENGIMSKAGKASEETQKASEKEAIELVMSDIKTELMIGEKVPKERYLGEELKRRTLGDTTSDWNVVTVDGKNYSNGWYLLEKGNEIENYGKAKGNWLINYTTGETMELEEGKYSKLSSKDVKNQVAKENLIFNLDSNIIDMAKNEAGEVTKESFEVLLDENSELVNFDWNGTTSGVTKTAFMFDGENDYIKVKYDDSLAYKSDGTPYTDEEGNKLTKKQVLAKNGLTFEFYGNIKSNFNNDIGYKGLFCYWNGDESIQADIRFGVDKTSNSLLWNVSWGESYSDYCGLSDIWNIHDPIDLNILNEDIYLAITLDTSNLYEVNEGNYKGDHSSDAKNGEFYKQTVYINGKKEYAGDFNKKQWEYLISNDLENLNYFCVGRSSMSDHGRWWYTDMETYALRLYNRALTETEVQKSYEDTVAAHNKLIADGN